MPVEGLKVKQGKEGSVIFVDKYNEKSEFVGHCLFFIHIVHKKEKKKKKWKRH